MVILAGAPPNQSMQIQELAGTGEIPVKFLEQILLSLKKAGLLKSKRGVGGGYQLNREARAISVGDVLEAIDGDLCSLAAGQREDFDFRGAGALQDCLQEVDRMVNEKLRSTSLEDLLESDTPADVGFGI